MDILNVVVTTDFSAPADRALDHGLALARWTHVPVVLVNVRPGPLPVGPLASAGMVEPPIAARHRQDELEARAARCRWCWAWWAASTHGPGKPWARGWPRSDSSRAAAPPPSGCRPPPWLPRC